MNPISPLRFLTLGSALGLAASLAQAQTAPAAVPPAAAASAPVVTMPPVTIQASADASAGGLTKPYAGGQVARGGRVGLLGNKDFMETPFASINYTQALIEDQQARSVADVLLDDPAVRNARGFGNFQELYVIRGFPIYSDDMAYNGLYGLLPRQYIAAELLERVEVFRGANSFLNGAAPGGSGLGGAINLLPKRAPNEPLNRVTLGVESGGEGYAAADIARRFGDKHAFGVRLNLAHRNGDTAIDDEHRRLDLASLGLDWHGDGVRVSADLGYQDHRLRAPRPSVTPVDGIPKPPDASSNFAQPWTRANERETFGTVRAEFDLGPASTAWLAAGARQGREYNLLANPTAMADGSTSAYRFDNARQDHVWTGEAGIRGRLSAAGMHHDLSLVAAKYSIDSRNAYAFSDFGGFPGNLYSPTAVPPPVPDFFVGGNLNAPLTTQKTSTTSVAVADNIGLLDDRVQVLLGARHQSIDDRTFDYDSGAQNSGYDKSRITPAVGVVYRLQPSLSLYANYVEGLVRGDVAPVTAPGGAIVTNGGEAFAPYRTKQGEVGVKIDTGRFGGQVALYRIDKPVGALQSNADGSATFVVGNAERHSGLEMSVFGEPLRGLRLLGGLNLIDAKLTDTDRNAIGVPKTQANVGIDWSVPGVPGLALDGRVVYTSRQYADAANTMALPSWTRLDLGARYEFALGERNVTLRARLDNVADRSYWASAGGYPGASYLVLAAPRTLTVSATVDF